MARPMLLRRGLGGAILACALVVAVPTAGAGTLDQSQPLIGGGLAFVRGTVQTAQTFRSGLTGRLDQVDVAVARSGAANALTVEIRTVSGGVPSATVLGSATVPATTVSLAGIPSGFVSVPIPASVPVTAGVQYAIVLSTTDCGPLNCYRWSFTFGANPYAAGAALQSQNGGPWGASGLLVDTDTAFKTYVAQAPTSKAHCKKGGWRHFVNPRFKNQGRCIAYVNHHNGKGKDNSKGATGRKGKGKKPR
jgi:hypothetical protein